MTKISILNHHHIPQDEPLQLTHEAVVMFLDSVLNQSAQVRFSPLQIGTFFEYFLFKGRSLIVPKSKREGRQNRRKPAVPRTNIKRSG
jgi:hypothetical protein